MTSRSVFFVLLLALLAPLSSVCESSSLELSFTYPIDTIAIGFKHGGSNVALGLSYKHNQRHYRFTTEHSHQSNPVIALSAILLVDQLNALTTTYAKDPKIEAYIKQLRAATFIKQKNECENLKQIEAILKQLGAYGDQ